MYNSTSDCNLITHFSNNVTDYNYIYNSQCHNVFSPPIQHQNRFFCRDGFDSGQNIQILSKDSLFISTYQHSFFSQVLSASMKSCLLTEIIAFEHPNLTSAPNICG